MITVVIPARMASSRYPGKLLESILGLPMVEHVRRRALLAQGVDLVAVATCDESIKEIVEACGGCAVMTKDTHERCTDRVEEAMQRLPGEIVAMVQGDEPLLIPEAISQVVQPLLDDPALDVVNLLSPLESPDDYANPNIVKAVCDRRGNVIYLTRAPVPFFVSSIIIIMFRYFMFDYSIRLIAKIIFLGSYCYLGTKIRVITSENFDLIKNVIRSKGVVQFEGD